LELTASTYVASFAFKFESFSGQHLELNWLCKDKSIYEITVKPTLLLCFVFLFVIVCGRCSTVKVCEGEQSIKQTPVRLRYYVECPFFLRGGSSEAVVPEALRKSFHQLNHSFHLVLKRKKTVRLTKACMQLLKRKIFTVQKGHGYAPELESWIV
jgi:hypothetical protein